MKQPTMFHVDGQDYTVQPFLTTSGMMILTELTSLLGDAAIRMMFELRDEGKAETAKSSLLEKNVDPEAAAAVMAKLTTKLKPEVVDALFKKILKNTLIGTTSRTCTEAYDSHFQNKYAHLFKVVFKSLQAQYGDFLDALGGVAGVTRANKQA